MKKLAKVNQDYIAYAFILPNYLIYFVFILIPLFSAVYLSFTRYNFLSAPRFVGLRNYIELFQDLNFIKALQNTTVFWIFTVIISMILGIILAVTLNQNLKGLSVFRAAYYLPNILSMVAIAMMWTWIYDPTRGILNELLGVFGVAPKDWLADQKMALGSIIVPSIWTMMGYNMVIYLAGLQNVPQQLYEAATIDGAGKLRQFFSITLPMLRPITFFLIVMSSIRSFQVFDQIYIMTRGGPAKATTTIAFEIYEKAFQFYRMGYSSAMAVVLLLIVGGITLINFSYGKGYGAEMK